MGWETLELWGDDVARVERLAGGVANDVWSVRVDGRLAVARLGARSDADLAWETELLHHLDRAPRGRPRTSLPSVVGIGTGTARRAEAAVCWDDDYSVKRLAEVRNV